MRLIFWSLRHRRARHAFNMLVLGLCVMVVAVFVSVVTHLVTLNKTITSQAVVRIHIEPKMGLDGTFPRSFVPTLEAIPGLQVEKTRLIRGRDRSGAFYLVGAVGPEWTSVPELMFPLSAEEREAWKKEEQPNAAIASARIAREMDLKVGQVVELPTEHGVVNVKIVAIASQPKVPVFITHYAYLEKLVDDPEKVNLRGYCAAADFARVGQEILERTKLTPTPAQVESDAQRTGATIKHVMEIPKLLGFLGAFLLLTTALTLANNSAMSIRERRIETATMRVIGFKPRFVLLMMLVEVGLVGLVAGVLAIGALLALFPAGIHLANNPLIRQVPIGVIGIVAGLVTAVGMPLVGTLPSALISIRTPLVRALRDTA